jgi:hypothetical protein
MPKEYIEDRESNCYIAGARISLDLIGYAFRRGESPEAICQNFELLRLEEVYGAITCYPANQPDRPVPTSTACLFPMMSAQCLLTSVPFKPMVITVPECSGFRKSLTSGRRLKNCR